MIKDAIFSEDRAYRYVLYRIWDDTKPRATFVGLNPSTADENVDDPTVRRCIRFAQDWGYGCLYMLNLFAFRATKPEDLKKVDEPIGSKNNDYLRFYERKSSLIVAAWGVHGVYRNREAEVRQLLPNLKCLGRTKDGHPKHPLYLCADTVLEDF